MSSPGVEALDVLIGKQLTSVEFVMDYVQLRFEGPSLTLTLVSLPTVIVGDEISEPRRSGWRDALCTRITSTVESARVEAGNFIEISFTDRSQLKISLLPGASPVEDAAILDDTMGNIVWVWLVEDCATE